MGYPAAEARAFIHRPSARAPLPNSCFGVPCRHVRPVWLQVARGGAVEIPYTVTVTKDAGTAVGTLAFKVMCPLAVAGQAVTVSGAASATGNTGSPPNDPKLATFSNVPYSSPPKAASGAVVGSITVECAGGPPSSVSVDISFPAANAKLIRDTATLTDVMTWPTWSSYYPQGGWLTTPPSTALSRGTSLTGGVTVTESQTFDYAHTVSNILLCFNGAPVSGLQCFECFPCVRVKEGRP